MRRSRLVAVPAGRTVNRTHVTRIRPHRPMALRHAFEIPHLIHSAGTTPLNRHPRRAASAAFFAVSLAALMAGSCDMPTNPEARGGWLAEQPGYAGARPALFDSLVIAAAGSGTVVARSRTTGAIAWRTQIPGGPGIGGERLIVSDGVVIVPVDVATFAMDAHSGAVLWRFTAPIDSLDKEGGLPLPGSVIGVRPEADSATAYLPAWGGSVTAADSRTGIARWQWIPTDSLARRFGARGVSLDGDRVIVTVWHFLNTTGSQCEGWVVALNRSTGAQLWRTVIPSSGEGVCVWGGPAVVSGYVVAATIDGLVYGLNAATGAIAWVRQPTPPTRGALDAILSGPIALDGVVLVDDGNSELLAIQPADGSVVRRSPYGGEVGGEFKDDPFATPLRIYAPDGKYLYVFDRATGRFLQALTQPNNTSNGLFPSAVVGDSARVYAPVNGGMWAFLAPRAGR